MHSKKHHFPPNRYIYLKRCTGVHWFANELIKAIVLLEINQLSTRRTSAQMIGPLFLLFSDKIKKAYWSLPCVLANLLHNINPFSADPFAINCLLVFSLLFEVARCLVADRIHRQSALSENTGLCSWQGVNGIFSCANIPSFLLLWVDD